MTEPLISDEERKQTWSDAFNSFHGLVSAMDVTVEYARRIEALVRKRLAERIRGKRVEVDSEYDSMETAAKVVEGSEYP